MSAAASYVVRYGFRRRIINQSLKNSPQGRVAYYLCAYYLCATAKNSFKNSSHICAAAILTPDNSLRSCIAAKSFRQKSYQSSRFFGRSAKYATILRTYSDNSVIIPCDYAASSSPGVFPVVLLLAQCRRIQSASLSLLRRRKPVNNLRQTPSVRAASCRPATEPTSAFASNKAMQPLAHFNAAREDTYKQNKTFRCAQTAGQTLQPAPIFGQLNRIVAPRRTKKQIFHR